MKNINNILPKLKNNRKLRPFTKEDIKIGTVLELEYNPNQETQYRKTYVIRKLVDSDMLCECVGYTYANNESWTNIDVNELTGLSLEVMKDDYKFYYIGQETDYPEYFI